MRLLQQKPDTKAHETQNTNKLFEVLDEKHSLCFCKQARDWTLNAWSAELFDCTGALYDIVFWFRISDLILSWFIKNQKFKGTEIHEWRMLLVAIFSMMH